jgi:HEAT repeat protein
MIRTWNTHEISVVAAMTGMREELLQALEADESGDLDAIIRQRRPEDFRALRRLLALGPATKTSHRAGAIYALGRWGDPAVIEAIRDLLPSLTHNERITAIDALGRLGTEEALDGILLYANDESLSVRKFVVRALGRINSPRARAGLSELQRTDASDYIRSLASSELSQR